METIKILKGEAGSYMRYNRGMEKSKDWCQSFQMFNCEVPGGFQEYSFQKVSNLYDSCIIQAWQVINFGVFFLSIIHNIRVEHLPWILGIGNTVVSKTNSLSLGSYILMGKTVNKQICIKWLRRKIGKSGDS